MLKVRVIPTLLWKNVGLVKGVGFNSWRRIGTVLPSIKVFNMREVDELILLDITATLEGREPDYNSISEFSSECFVPLTVGGGICNIKQIKKLLRAGADKVAINTAAYVHPEIISLAAEKYGSQCIVASIDVRKIGDKDMCYSHCGGQQTHEEVVVWARKIEKLGAGEILLTSVERDGTMLGYDLGLIKAITDNVNIPVIASGGAGNYQHMCDAINIANASAVAAASIFQFTYQTPLEAKHYMARNNIKVRNVNVAPKVSVR